MTIRMRPDVPARGFRRKRLGPRLLLPAFLLLLFGASSEARAEGWGFGWELGAITATPKGSPFVFRLTAAKNLSEEFSVGPAFYVTPYGDDAMYSGSLNAEFHVAVQGIRISPFFGFGIANRKTDDDSDTAVLVPMGLSLDKPVGERLYLVGTFGINLHSGMKLEGEKDGASIGLTAGIRYSM